MKLAVKLYILKSAVNLNIVQQIICLKRAVNLNRRNKTYV